MALSDLPAGGRELALGFLTGLGDDEYLHGDRLSAWLTVAPTLEEDNVLTSVAQDEMGHARLWYEVVADHRAATVDELAIHRPPAERRNSTLVEREHADFADTVVRSFLYDRYEELLLEAMADGDHAELTDRASVALNEEPFHREHVGEWLEVFDSLAREADRERVREAVLSNLRHAGDLFGVDPGLQGAGVLAEAPAALAADWREAVLPRLAALPVGLDRPDLEAALDADAPDGRAGEHTDDLAALVEAMRPREIERLSQ